jgi:hypothetical protein
LSAFTVTGVFFVSSAQAWREKPVRMPVLRRTHTMYVVENFILLVHPKKETMQVLRLKTEGPSGKSAAKPGRPIKAA